MLTEREREILDFILDVEAEAGDDGDRQFEGDEVRALRAKLLPPAGPERRYDVNASVYEMDGRGSDGAYSMICRGATAAEIGRQLTEVLSGDWGLANSDGPFRLEINVGPAGRGDDLPM
jgi:hypothetical protein